jgi:hypothetical protein
MFKVNDRTSHHRGLYPRDRDIQARRVIPEKTGRSPVVHP